MLTKNASQIIPFEDDFMFKDKISSFETFSWKIFQNRCTKSQMSMKMKMKMKGYISKALYPTRLYRNLEDSDDKLTFDDKFFTALFYSLYSS